MSILRKHIKIHGKVQGVGFRQNAFILAQKLAVTGWVRNTADGDVEAVVEGHPSSVQLFVEWCHEGPIHAVVTSVVVIQSIETETSELTSFTVQKTT